MHLVVTIALGILLAQVLSGFGEILWKFVAFFFKKDDDPHDWQGL